MFDVYFVEVVESLASVLVDVTRTYNHVGLVL